MSTGSVLIINRATSQLRPKATYSALNCLSSFELLTTHATRLHAPSLGTTSSVFAVMLYLIGS
uniref:Uncharacterized protein n=1 Tax=Triticum urartu TaxID=4572 RepID=A0A8R7QJR3_TRIUA